MDDYSLATDDSIVQSEFNDKKPRKISAPFGYFGSKNKIALRLCKELPPHYCWVEAFCGSASLTLAKPPAPIEVINDIDNQIVNVFKQLRGNFQELRRLLEFTPYSRQEFLEASIFNPTDTDLEKARKFLVQVMMTVNGALGKDKGGFSYSQSYSRNGMDARVSRWFNLPERLALVVKRLRNVRIDNRDAKEILKMFINRPATLIYLDPPYLGNRASGYNNDLNDEIYHEELLELANEAKCMVFISGYESDLYNSLLTESKGWVKKTISTYTKGTNGKSHERNEVIWMNNQYQKAVETNQVPITLTEKEKKEKKLNPLR